MADYGANSSQVGRFVRRVRSLSDAQWSDILARKAAYALFGAFDSQVVELEGYKAHGVDKANKILDRAMREAGLDRPVHHERWDLGVKAILALLYPGVMWVEHFSAAYGPFASAIPIAELGPGSAPTLLPMPETLGDRFVARVRNFPNQQGALAIAYALQELVGAERMEKASNTALESGIDVDEALDINARLSELLGAEVEQLTNLWRMVVTKVGGTEERVQAQSQFYQSQREQFRLCAFRAAVGLLARGLVSDEDFTLLYLPLVAFIPPESLDIG